MNPLNVATIPIHPHKMDCKGCHHRCKADCCSCAAPIDREIYYRNWDKRLRKVVKEEFLHDAVIPLTEDTKCTFLKDDLSCNIYDDRPHLCKKFGDESSPLMTCSYQSKDGRIRSRQERRALERKILKDQNSKLKIFE